MPKKSLAKDALYFILSFFVVIIFLKPVFANEPIIEKIFSYQPESDRGILQTVVFGKHLDELELESEDCRYISSMPFEDHFTSFL